MKSIQLTFLFLLTYMVSFANAESVYLFYDDTCIDQYTYQKTKQDNRGAITNHKHYAYHIRINDNERVVLNIGQEGNDVSNYRPSNLKYCGDVVISESFSRRINTEDIKVFLVKKQANSNTYKVMAVKSADYFFTTDAELGYASKKFTFAYNFASKSKADLSTKDSKGNVYFQKRDDNYCPSKYTFRRTASKNFASDTDFTLIPDIGLVESQKVSNGRSQKLLKLEQINSIPLAQYMDAVCNGYVKYLNRDNVGDPGKKSRLAQLEGTKITPNRNTTTYNNSSRTTPSTSTTTYNSSNYKPYTGSYTNSNNTVAYYNPPPSVCSHIYKDVDRGFYYNKDTGGLANGECGGITYRNGMMLHNSTSYPSTSTTTSSYTSTYTPPATTYTPPTKSYATTPSTDVYVYSEPQKTILPDEFATRVATPTPAPCNLTADYNHHIVQQSETLYRISRNYGIALADLRAWNSLQNTNFISPCTKLRIAAPARKTPTSFSERSVTTTPLIKYEKTDDVYHTVQPEESLYSIATKHGFTVERLKDMNGLKSNTILPGQRLKISDCNCTTPKGGSSTSAPIPYEYDAKGLSQYKGKVHIVRDNETLYSIAKRYNTTVAYLRDINGLDRAEVIIPSQKLRIVR